MSISIILVALTDVTFPSIRSASILFLPAESNIKGQPSTSGVKDTANPFWVGFGCSQTGNAIGVTVYSQSLSDRDNSKEEFVETWDTTSDAYHHPAWRRSRTSTYKQAFDIYS